MSPIVTTPNPQQIISRIDTIIRELETLRQILTDPAPTIAEPKRKNGLTEELFGAAGQGSWDEYDPNIDFLRFADEYVS
ncbi:MAG: hypothetical protein ISS57_19000 [Anaerolineales bacterium]|nr:hypothetical protein [Anaerolineales bacterium]